ncbi:glutathione-disulfide reductase [Rhodobacterales bacterium LSUCC0246]|nr:glutathione-disulfide reductase [Rhodobacterales bacterium LSUCC0374]
MTFDYDLFVIGGGSGGVRAARVAAGLGVKVALAEESRMGGTCVIRGCVPKKLMVFASEYAPMVEDAVAYGWDISLGAFHWPNFQRKLSAELDRLEGLYNGLLDKSGVTVFAQRATLSDPHSVRLADGTVKSAKHILIATGGRPVRPDAKGAEYGIVSDDIFNLPQLPKSILIVGGGYIACEFSCILSGLGVEVTQYYRGAQILRGFDDEARGLICDQMRANGISIHMCTDVIGIEKTDNGLRVEATNGEIQNFEHVFFATGRRPNTDELGLEGLGVDLGRGGEIVVDQFSQTAVPSIYAIGDVTDRVNLTPVAIREAMAFVATVFEGKKTPVDHDLIPSAVFTQPEFGTVGLSEEAARAAGQIEVYATSFKPMQSSFAGRFDRVMMKLVVCATTRRVLGCHIVAPQAGEMIQLAGIAVKMGATKEDFDRVCAVHPTMSEELVTLKTPVRVA